MDEKAKTKGQLFLSLEADGVNVSMDVINKAMEGDGQALFSIGYIYDIQRQEYVKAMEWYLLSANADYPGAQNNIGNMYYMGSGVSIDYLLALEWYLKAASHKNKFAFENIGRIFEKGLGVLDDKYIALEWYRRNKHTAEAARRLKDKGYHVPPLKKNKKIEQLIKETEAITKEEKLRKRSVIAEEYKPLPDLNTSVEREVKTRSYKPNSIEDDLRSMLSLSYSKHDSDKESYKLTDEIPLLKQEKIALEQQIKTNDHTIKTLENENSTHRTLSAQQSQKIDALNVTNQSLEKENQILKQANIALEQELKNHVSKKANETIESLKNEIELIKHSMQLSLDKEKQRRAKLEKENMKLKRERKKNDTSDNDDDDPTNDINYDSEVDSHESENDINYDTPVEYDEDNNDLNYDSDEQTSKSNKNNSLVAN